MREKGLSVIIPVYMVEATLDQCIESVLEQQVADMEIILVDDGSPDYCAQLCDEWSVKYPIIRTIHKTNGGLSDARNVGIELANKEYITFVDSDDYLEKDTYPALLAYLEENQDCDIVEFPVNQYEGSDNVQLLSLGNKVYTDIREYWYETAAYCHTYAWNKIYRRELFDEVRFPKGRVFEDTYTFPLLLGKTKKIATCSKGMYHYCHNAEGITSRASGEQWRMLLDAHMRIVNNPMFQPVTEAYYVHLLDIQLYTSELTGDKPLMPPVRFKRIRTFKTIMNNILGIETFCKWNRSFRKFVRRHT